MKKSGLEEQTQFSRMPILHFFKENNRIAYIFFLVMPLRLSKMKALI